MQHDYRHQGGQLLWQVWVVCHLEFQALYKNAPIFSEGQYIVAGSDEGYIFCWDRKSANVVAVLNGDESIVNCLQGHPADCLLATSGIETVVRLWAPRPEVQYAKSPSECRSLLVTPTLRLLGRFFE